MPWLPQCYLLLFQSCLPNSTEKTTHAYRTCWHKLQFYRCMYQRLEDLGLCRFVYGKGYVREQVYQLLNGFRYLGLICQRRKKCRLSSAILQVMTIKKSQHYRLYQSLKLQFQEAFYKNGANSSFWKKLEKRPSILRSRGKIHHFGAIYSKVGKIWSDFRCRVKSRMIH